MIEFTFLKEFILIRQVNQKSVKSVTIVIFQMKGLSFNMGVYDGCHDLSMMPMKLGNIAILSIHGADYSFIISGISELAKAKL